jgi:hypothetical protein
MAKIKDKRVLRHLITFADGYYTISQTGGSPYFNVLRFGQVQGWRLSDARLY